MENRLFSLLSQSPLFTPVPEIREIMWARITPMARQFKIELKDGTTIVLSVESKDPPLVWFSKLPRVIQLHELKYCKEDDVVAIEEMPK